MFRWPSIVESLVEPMRDRLVALLHLALPALGRQELFVVMSAISGAYVYPQLFGKPLADSLGLDLATIDWAEGAAQLGMLFRKGVN